jgi:lipopolysaccharide export system ATP-binding protein
MKTTIQSESTPNLDISFTVCLKKTLHRSGTVNVRSIRITYWPNFFITYYPCDISSSEFSGTNVMNFYYFCGKIDRSLMEQMILRTEDLVKRYRNRTVVNHVSIQVKQGEIVGLLGPNGAGKTTTFYMAVGLVAPNQGKIFLEDMDITQFPVYKRARKGIGYLSQEASVFRKLSVEDNLRAVLEMTQQTAEYQEEKLEGLINEFGLQKVRKNLGDQLSGGERRRVEIARCLAIDPKFIMLDEPFAGIDPIAVQDIQHIVGRLKLKNIGILITDHNVHETLSITDRAYLLFEGKVLFQGTAEELAENPVVREKYLGRDFELRKKASIY